MDLPEKIKVGLAQIDNFGFSRKLNLYVVSTMGKICEEAENEKSEIFRLAQYEIKAFSIFPQSFVSCKDYSARVYEIDSWLIEQLEYYKMRFESSENSQLACRYGDILLNYGGPLKIAEKCDIFTRMIPLLLSVAQAAVTQPKKEYTIGIDSFSRAIELCLFFNNTELLRKTVDSLMLFINDIGTVHNYRWIIEPSKMLISIIRDLQFRDAITSSDIDLVVTKLNEARNNWVRNNNYNLRRSIL